MSTNSRQTRRQSNNAVVQTIESRRTQTKQPDCRLCQQDHPLRTCQKFNNMTIQRKLKIVKKHNYCRNCLAYSHVLARCRSSERCRLCRRTHHTLLHQEIVSTARNKGRPVRNSARNAVRPIRNVSPEVTLINSIVLRPTVIISLKLGEDWGNIRGILDPTSETSKISEFLPKRFKFPTETTGSQRICKVTFKPHFVDGPIFIINATIIKGLPKRFITKDLDEKVTDPYNNLRLADPDFFKAREINIILGADVYSHVIKAAINPPTLTSPMAQDTLLGWILIGKMRL